MIISQADASGAATQSGQQLGSSKQSDAEKPQREASAYTCLNDLRRMLDLPPIDLPSTMPSEGDPTNDFEAVSSIVRHDSLTRLLSHEGSRTTGMAQRACPLQREMGTQTALLHVCVCSDSGNAVACAPGGLW